MVAVMTDNTNKISDKNNDLASIISSLGDGRKIPPLDKWSPTNITPFDIIIKDNGDWYHEGSKITRQSLVDLFASVLWAENDKGQKRHFLKTPTDKYEIQVADTPLFINTVDIVNQNGDDWIVFGTTNGDSILLDDESLYFKTVIHDGIPDDRLYIDTRFNLTARISRNVFYHLMELGTLTEEQGQTVLILQSGNKTHRLIAPTPSTSPNTSSP